MRVAIVFPHLPLKEEERTTYERSLRERYVSRRLNEEGHQALLCYLTHEEKPFSVGEGANTAHFFPLDARTRSKARKFYTSRRLGETLKDFGPDVVIFKGMGYFLPYWLLKNRFIPWNIAFITGGNPDDILIPASSFIFSEYSSQLTGIYARFSREGRALVLGKYVPDVDFRGDKTGEFDIVSVGSLSPLKNHRALIPLFKTRSVLLVGEGPERGVLEEAARGCDGVVFTGAVPKEGVSSHIRRARLMVHPSTFEGFPRVFSEAFAAGVPVVALKRAIRGEFPEDKAGLLVEEQDLVESVNRLLEDRPRLDTFSRQARALAETSYRGNVVYAQILEGLKVMQERSPGNSRSLYRFFLLPWRRVVWFLDYYYYFLGRTVKRAVKARLKKG